MENVDRLSNYLVLLKIRQRAFFRNVLISGGLYLFTILSTTGLLLMTEWNGRSIYLMIIFDVLIAAGFLMSWIGYEIVKGNIDLLNNILGSNAS
jgi:hypothetical protein